MGIREGGNVKKCRPVVKEPSGGTLLFRCALPARGASIDWCDSTSPCLSLPRRCLHGVHLGNINQGTIAILCLGAACTGCILRPHGRRGRGRNFASALPARGASMHIWRKSNSVELCLGAACAGCIGPSLARPFCMCRLCLGAACTGCIGGVAGNLLVLIGLCLGAACTGCIPLRSKPEHPSLNFASALPARGASRQRGRLRRTAPSLPRRCLHGVHLRLVDGGIHRQGFASALPARGASCPLYPAKGESGLCLGAACTGCITSSTSSACKLTCFASALPARGASPDAPVSVAFTLFASALPARGASPGRLPDSPDTALCLGAACTGCIAHCCTAWPMAIALPRRCLHGVHLHSGCSRQR